MALVLFSVHISLGQSKGEADLDSKPYKKYLYFSYQYA